MPKSHIVEDDTSVAYKDLLDQIQQLKQLNSDLEIELIDTKRQLEEQSCLFDTVMESSLAGYWDWHINKDYEHLSPGFKKMLGYENHELPNHPSSWQKMIHPDDLPGLLKKFEEHVESRGKIPFDHEGRYYHKNGYIVDIYCRGQVVSWDENNHALRAIGVHIDISRQKQTERALIASNQEYEALYKEQLSMEEELRRAVEYQKDIIFKLERKERKLKEIQQLTGVGYFVYYFKSKKAFWSPEIYTQFGLIPNEPPPVGEAFFKLIHPDDKDQAKKAKTKALKEGTVTLEQRIIRPDKSIAYLKCTIKPWRDEQGNVAGIYGGSMDITDIKTAQEEILKSEALQRAIFNSSLDALFIVDAHDARIIEYNDRAVQLFECGKKEELLGIQATTLRRKPLSAKETKEMIRELSGRESWSSEVEYITKKGKSFWGSLAISRIEADTAKMALVRITDISERIKIRELLTRTQQMATIGGWEYDLQSQKVSWTDEMFQLYGLPVGTDITLELMLSYYAPEYVEQVLQDFEDLIKKGGRLDFESELINSRHQRVWVKSMVKAHRENNRTIKLSGTFQNIDDQKREELLLQARQSELCAFVEAAPAAIAMLDKNLCYIAASEKWHEDYNLLDQKILGTHHYDIFPDTPEEWKEMHQRCLQGAIEKKEEDQYTRKDGTIQWLKWEVRPWYDSEGNIGGIIIFREDITNRKKQEEELISAKKKAEEASMAKAQFLSTMSHEIRTPMNAVIGISHILLQDDPKPDQVENLKVLQFSAENLLALINDILDFSKIEAGKIELEQADFSIRDLIYGIKKSLSFNAEEKGIELKVLLDEAIPEVVVGDPIRLSQILINLVSNAIKFTEKGSVTIVMETVHRNGDTISLHFGVKDTGIGIPADKLEEIFENFSQADTHTTRKYGGTGLGLAITKRLLEIFGSQIHVESTPGQGSHFYFDISFKVNESKTIRALGSEHTQANFESLEGYKVLLVEDNAINVLIAKKFLDKWNLAFDHAENGQIAIELALQNEYDLILMDLQMPIIDGFEATRQIKASGNQTLIIALTASAMQEAQEKILITGMIDFVIKPFNPHELYLKIKKYLPVKEWANI